LDLKQDVAKLMGSLFGKETEKLFLDYYDVKQPVELMRACKDMLVKLLGPAVADKHYNELIKKHPELEKLKKVV
jgi:hypothetical protein